MAIYALGLTPKMIKRGLCLDLSQCQTLMIPDLIQAKQFKKRTFGDQLTCECAESVAIDLAYGTFEGGFEYMTPFKDFMVAGDWNGAADYLKNQTIYCLKTQNFAKCERNVKLLLSCTEREVVDPAQHCVKDMANLKAIAQQGSSGFTPDGHSYSHVADFIDAVGYGGILKGGFNDAIPSDFWSVARNFSDFLNTGGHAFKFGLVNIQA